LAADPMLAAQAKPSRKGTGSSRHRAQASPHLRRDDHEGEKQQHCRQVDCAAGVLDGHRFAANNRQRPSSAMPSRVMFH